MLADTSGSILKVRDMHKYLRYHTKDSRYAQILKVVYLRYQISGDT